MKRLAATASALILGAASATTYAHGLHGGVGFGAGFAHPFLGIDHVFAMVVIGMYAVQVRRGFRLSVGAAALAAIAAGALLGAPPAAPFFEGIVALSVCALGLMLLAGRAIAPAWAILGILVFSFAHGVMHAVEQPVEFGTPEYVAGVLAASAELQLVGAALAIVLKQHVRLAGMSIAAAGACILIAAVM